MRYSVWHFHRAAKKFDVPSVRPTANLRDAAIVIDWQVGLATAQLEDVINTLRGNIDADTQAQIDIALSMLSSADPAIGQMLADLVAAKAPLGRAGQPADLEGAVVYLASDMAAYHTGDTLVIDGGKLFAN